MRATLTRVSGLARLSGAIAALTLVTATALLATPAAAEDVSVRIPVVQADLDTPAALTSLYGRVEAAAGQLCRRALLDGDAAYVSVTACKRDTVARAIQGANLAELTAFHTEMVERATVRSSPVLASR